MERDRVRRLVHRARARLEAVRLLKGAARGALAGGALGLLVLLLDRALAGFHAASWIPWACLGAGAGAGALLAALRGRIGLPEAALFLDRRLGTEERIVTVLTREEDAFTDRAAAELDERLRVPRLALPREAGWVPAALFLLFAAGLLPEAGSRAEAAPGTATAVRSAAPGRAARTPPPDVSEAVEGLRAGRTPTAKEAERILEAIRRGVHRPEERREAREALDRALEGDAAAGEEVANALAGMQGGAGGESGDPEPGSPRTVPGTKRGPGATSAYPEAEEFLLEYRRALLEERR